MMVGRLVFARGTLGMTEASTTRKLLTPLTRQFWSTTAAGSSGRPIMQVLTRPQPVAPAPASVEYAAQLQPLMGGGGRVMGLPLGYDDRMAAARSVAGQDPRQVAQVVRNWVAQDNG